MKIGDHIKAWNGRKQGRLNIGKYYKDLVEASFEGISEKILMGKEEFL
jgi:hypothetical protein